MNVIIMIIFSSERQTMTGKTFDADYMSNMEDGMRSSVRAMVTGLTIGMTKTNKKYADGVLTADGGSVRFKKWDYNDSDTLENKTVYDLNGKFAKWGGAWQFTIDSYRKIDDADPEDYEAPSPYDVDKIHHEINEELKSRVSDKGIKLMRLLLCGSKDDGVPNLSKRYQTEFAAIYHHDAVPGGLLAHSFKTFKFTCAFIDLADDGCYKIPDSQDFKDIVLVGSVMHDIGKTIEYNQGGISEIGKYVSHRTLACMRLTRLHDKVAALYGEDGYNKLMSIFAQHHGDFEETPRTKEAIIIHAADQMDSIISDVTTSWFNAGNGEDGVSFKYNDKKMI